MPRTTTRTVHTTQVLAPEVVAKRTKRHLEELERTNYAASSLLNEPDSDPEAPSTQKSKFRARQTVISDKRTFPAANPAKKKKSTMNVRTAILYRKGLAALLDESGLAPTQPSYLSATAPPPPAPRRVFCSVCGFKGAYRCRQCGLSYCDVRCGHVHAETRCERVS